MNWYNVFNALEAVLWWIIAVIIQVRVPANSRQQQLAIGIASIAFLAFGMTDLLEIGRDGHLPLWLWACKILCGATILASRYMWVGWNRFRWKDREFLFGVFCLISVAVVIYLERQLN